MSRAFCEGCSATLKLCHLFVHVPQGPELKTLVEQVQLLGKTGLQFFIDIQKVVNKLLPYVVGYWGPWKVVS